MPWIPSDTLLGTVKEYQNFNFSVRYSAADPVTSAETFYPVTITAATAKPTVVITNGLNASISGFFRFVFNDTIQYRDFNGNIVTLNGDETTGAWDKLDINNASNITSFRPDSNRSVTLNYTATARDNNTVIATQSFTITIADPNWTTGQLNLKNAVASTVARN